MLAQLYYWMCQYLKKVKTNDQPFFNAYLGITFFSCINIVAVGRILYHFKLISGSKEASSFFGLMLYLLVSGILFFTLYLKRVSIENTINEYPARKLKTSKFIFWTYIISSSIIMSIVLLYF
jgi:hypothetical protein